VDNRLYHYNALDAACTLEAKEAFWPDLLEGFLPAYDLTLNLFPVLTFLQTRGIRVDKEQLEKVQKDIIKSAEDKQEELNRLCGRELNVNSTQQCQQYFYVEKGIPPYYNEGRVTTDDTALQRIARGTAKRAGLREARLVQEIRGCKKLNSTYLSMEFDADSRFRSSYNPRGTKFGRVSSSQTIFGSGGNAQNLDPEFKGFLVPDEGYVFWEVDKRQAEWVVVAYLTGDANMLYAVESGLDTHIHTAHLAFGVDKDVLELEAKLVGSKTDPELIEEIRNSDPILAKYCSNLPRVMSGRQCGKKSNHGFNYDEGPAMWALKNEVPIGEAKRVHALYHSSYPGIRIWYEAIKRQLQANNRVLTNCFGRKIRFMGSWDTDLFKSAYSALPQSTVVDSLNEGMIKIYDDNEISSTQGFNLDILAQVHDSILMQVPISSFLNPAFSQIVQRVYDYTSPNLEYNGRSFKIATDSKIGWNWGGYHPKNNPLGMREVKDYSEMVSLLEEVGREQGTSRLD